MENLVLSQPPNKMPAITFSISEILSTVLREWLAQSKEKTNDMKEQQKQAGYAEAVFVVTQLSGWRGTDSATGACTIYTIQSDVQRRMSKR